MPTLGNRRVPRAGVPAGGLVDQILAKVSGSDYDLEWVTPSTTANALATTGASVNVSNAAPPVAGQFLGASSATQGAWQNVTSGGNLIDATNSAYGLSTAGSAAANVTALGLANTAAVAAGMTATDGVVSSGVRSMPERVLYKAKLLISG